MLEWFRVCDTKLRLSHACLAIVAYTTLSTNYYRTNDRIIAPYELGWVSEMCLWCYRPDLHMANERRRKSGISTWIRVEWNKRESRMWLYIDIIVDARRTHAGGSMLYFIRWDRREVQKKKNKDKWYDGLDSLAFADIHSTSTYVSGPFFFYLHRLQFILGAHELWHTTLRTEISYH